MTTRRRRCRRVLGFLVMLLVAGCDAAAPTPEPARQPARVDSGQGADTQGAATRPGDTQTAGSTSTSSKGPSDAFLIAPDRVGAFSRGMSMDDVIAAAGRENVSLFDRQIEGFFAPAMRVRIPGWDTLPSLTLEVAQYPCREFHVGSIEVNDPRFRTQHGVGVGSTLREVRAHFDVDVTKEEGWKAITRDRRLAFRLHGGNSAQPDTVVSALYTIGSATCER